jgi:hypothetical protein
MALDTIIEDVRAVLGDNDPDVQLRTDFQISQAIRLAIRTGKINNAEDESYSISGDVITPEVTPEATPEAYARLVWATAKSFTNMLTASSFSTRAFRRVNGDGRELMMAVIEELYKAENGGMCG